jgi:hypothetical protein
MPRIGVSVGMGRRRRGGGAAPWLPSSLTGYVGSPFSVAYFRGLGTLWQDTAKTIAAVVDGDPVRVAVCDGVDWTAPTDAARPLLWDEGGGLWSFYFDGVDDCLVNATVPGVQPVTLGVRCQTVYTGDHTYGRISDAAAEINGRFLTHNAHPGVQQIQMHAGATLQTATGVVAGDEWRTVVAVYAGASSVLRVSGLSEITGAAGTNTATGLIIGGAPGGNYYGGRVAGFVAASATVVIADRDQMESYLTALA